jgi:hypothetical protein
VQSTFGFYYGNSRKEAWSAKRPTSFLKVVAFADLQLGCLGIYGFTFSTNFLKTKNRSTNLPF